jgi:hypothetical protein
MMFEVGFHNNHIADLVVVVVYTIFRMNFFFSSILFPVFIRDGIGYFMYPKKTRVVRPDIKFALWKKSYYWRSCISK